MKFRTSSHCLMVETGRYSRPKIKRENRICTLCNTKEVEDERHLIFHCNAYSELRKTFFDKIHGIVQLNPNDENSFIKTIFFYRKCNSSFFCCKLYKCFEKTKRHHSPVLCLMPTLLIRNDVQNYRFNV